MYAQAGIVRGGASVGLLGLRYSARIIVPFCSPGDACNLAMNVLAWRISALSVRIAAGLLPAWLVPDALSSALLAHVNRFGCVHVFRGTCCFCSANVAGAHRLF